MAEMWSIIVLTILFWGFCNEITKIEDAKRFYALIATSANGASIISGKFVQFTSNFVANSWDQAVILLMGSVIISCGIILFIFLKLNKSHPPANNPKTSAISVEKINNKISLTESIKYLFRYRYISFLAIMVITYNVVFNLADVIWIDQLHKRFAAAIDLNNYLAQLDFLVGIFSLIISIFIFTNAINKFGWKITAMIPPTIWLITSTLLYAAIYTEKFGFALNSIIITLGTLQISLGKATKYCIFDQVKEMSFIPLSIEQQRNSKAAVDGLVSRLGKSSGSIILQTFLFLGITDMASIIPTIALLIILAITVWSYATCKMGDCISTQKQLA
jgi:AAA family ATP:ADP antiporter